ncbi:MAG: ADP-glyceromanno-heptose 6-epimerase [Rickettsiales bacterium]|nr:ADP-glyceromanno-heptose 6-epimerase [Rickettsiales bacterium]
MIIITGGAGFIGSNLVNELLNYKHKIVICDYKNKINKKYYKKFDNIFDIVEPNNLETFIEKNSIDIIFHLGAISSTIFKDGNLMWANNILFSHNIWKICSKKNIRLIYASSAATYGNGENGFKDNHDNSYLKLLNPLNIYAWTKNEIDKRNMYLKNNLNICPPQWIALKFFNVYGPNEHHKDNMISMVLKTYNQINRKEATSLFKSHNIKYKDGEQKRDFIYVKDCIKVLIWFMKNNRVSGVYNVGTGKARTFNDLVCSVYSTLKKNINIKYIDMPINIRGQYQYLTEASIYNLRKAGYDEKFFSLEEGIRDYINNYLINSDDDFS